MQVVSGLYRRFQVVIHEIAKFGVVGAFNFALDVALFNVLRSADVGPLTSKTVAVSVAATSSYFMNRHWSFAHRARSGVRREYTLFIALSAVGLAIALACLGVSHYVLGFKSRLADNVAGNGLGTVFGMAWRFWSFKRWVFLPTSPDGPSPAEAAVVTTT
ncbi:MAG TPA: GtrA family protein [Mycobacteriales bacterium]